MGFLELKQEAIGLDSAELQSVRVGGRATPEENFRAVFNIEQQKVAAIVSDRYNVVQHQHLINSTAEALHNLNIPFNHKVHNFGNKIVIDLTFPDAKMYVQKGEEFFSGVRLVNSYDKTTGVQVLPHLVRLACMNGMTVNVGWVKEFSVAHSNVLAKDVQVSIELMLKEMVDGNDKLKAMINNCIGDSIEWEIMDSIISKLVEGRSKHFEAIKKLMHESVGDNVATRWDLYNAFTNYATHGEQLKPSLEMWLQNKAQKVLVEKLGELRPRPKALA